MWWRRFTGDGWGMSLTMGERGPGRRPDGTGVSRFGLAPPRRFLLPAILLLLSERPGYGYGLVPRLEEFQFGHVDRPAVYRALAQLEADRLVECAPGTPGGGQGRRVYRVTDLGQQVLRVWMGVVKDEQEGLGRVLRRYQATGTTDAMLAEVEGGWAAALGAGWSPVSTSTAGRRHLVPVGPASGRPTTPASGRPATPPSGRPAADPRPSGVRAPVGTPPPAGRYRLVADRSVVLIEVRSTVGPLQFGTVGVSGWIDGAVRGGGPHPKVPASARLRIDVSGLRSGNEVYDAELLRRIDARRFPTATVEAHECCAVGPGGLYRLHGTLTFHGTTRPMQGTVTVDAADGDRVVVTGEQALDIRDFAIPSPTMLMLRIYPDVRVHLHVEAELEEEP